MKPRTDLVDILEGLLPFSNPPPLPKWMMETGKCFLLTAFESLDDLIPYGVTIQMKTFQQYFHMVLFIQYIVLTFVSVK